MGTGRSQAALLRGGEMLQRVGALPGGFAAAWRSSASLSKARPMASSSSASSKLAMPCAKRKHRSASLRKASANRGGSSSSDKRQRVNKGTIDDGLDPGYPMARS